MKTYQKLKVFLKTIFFLEAISNKNEVDKTIFKAAIIQQRNI